MFYSLKNPPLFISPIGQKRNHKLFQLRKQIASDKKKKKEREVCYLLFTYLPKRFKISSYYVKYVWLSFGWGFTMAASPWQY